MDIWGLLPVHLATHTFHLVLSIGGDAIQYHLIEHLPIWGFRLVSTREAPEWGKFLENLLQDTTTPDAKLILLQNGMFLEKGHLITSDDLTQFLRETFRKCLPINKLDSILPIGLQVLPEFYQAIQETYPGSNLLPYAPLPFPLTEYLEIYIKIQKCISDTSYSVLVAKLDENKFHCTRKTLIAKGAKEQSPGLIGGSYLFFTPLNHQTARILIFKSKNHAESEELFSAQEVEMAGHTLDINISIKYPNYIPEIKYGGVNRTKNINVQSIKTSSILANVVKQYDPIYIAFLIDGTMNAQDFANARKSVIRIVHALANNMSAVNAIYIIYGERKFTKADGRKWESDYEVIVGDFYSPGEFEKKINRIKPLTPFDNDYCDALELGLNRLNTLELPSQSISLILLGNSPPHPIPQDLKKYDLGRSDFSTDEFGVTLSWENEFQKFTTNHNVLSMSVWIEPTDWPNLRKSHRNYALHVWKTIGATNFYNTLNQDVEEAILKTIQNFRPYKLVLDHPLELPMLAPYDELFNYSPD